MGLDGLGAAVSVGEIAAGTRDVEDEDAGTGTDVVKPGVETVGGNEVGSCGAIEAN